MLLIFFELVYKLMTVFFVFCVTCVVFDENNLDAALSATKLKKYVQWTLAHLAVIKISLEVLAVIKISLEVSSKIRTFFISNYSVITHILDLLRRY